MLPSLEADSYGEVDGVAAYVPYTINGQFNDNTKPTYVQVVRWIDQVSDMFNMAMSQYGFAVPVVQPDAKSAIAAMVEQLVADLVMAANSGGRFYSARNQEAGVSPMAIIRKEILLWVKDNSSGLENAGVPRVAGSLGEIGSLGRDVSGEELSPIFQRKGFGNRFDDWTPRK